MTIILLQCYDKQNKTAKDSEGEKYNRISSQRERPEVGAPYWNLLESSPGVADRTGDFPLVGSDVNSTRYNGNKIELFQAVSVLTKCGSLYPNPGGTAYCNLRPVALAAGRFLFAEKKKLEEKYYERAVS